MGAAFHIDVVNPVRARSAVRLLPSPMTFGRRVNRGNPRKCGWAPRPAAHLPGAALALHDGGETWDRRIRLDVAGGRTAGGKGRGQSGVRQPHLPDAHGAEPRRPLRHARAALRRAAGLRPLLHGTDEAAGGFVGGAAGRPQMARPQARPRARLVPAAGHGGLRLLRRPLRRRPPPCRRAARLPGKPRHHLCPPDAVPEAAAGRQRRRLFGDGLSRHRPGVRHHGRSGGAGRALAPARHEPVHRPGAEPHRQGARLGEEGAEGRRRSIRTTT